MLNEVSAKALVIKFWNGTVQSAPAPMDSPSILEDVLRRYCEPGRHYHNLTHIAKMLLFILDHEPNSNNLNELVLATVFHDVIYDSKRPDNEEQSAAMADISLRRLGYSNDLIQRIVTLILCSKSHQAAFTDFNSLLFVDADLSIFGAPANEYDEYASAIRREYAFVPEPDYRKGRIQVLQRFLDRASIYLVPRLEADLGLTARANLRREIEKLKVPG